MNLVFMGTPAFAVPSLEALVAARFRPSLVITQPSARRSRRGEAERSELGAAAVKLGLDVMESEKISATPEFEKLTALKPDLIVVVAFGQILRKNVLTLPRFGCINLHPSKLPAYRGAAPIQRAIMDGVETSGITVMKIGVKLDAGPILAQKDFPISPEETAEEAGVRAAKDGAAMIVDVVRAYASGTPPKETPQDDALATYAHMLAKEDGAIHFDRPANRVWDQIRGVTPWPRAYTYHPGKRGVTRLIVHRAEPATNTSGAAPGTITAINQRGIEIACATTSLVLTRLQAEGKPVREAADFLRGFPMEPGERLSARP
ncbi:MAG: methionyl-tRNA formyltransferase [Planctomycetes bacterium]|nr:methionyl-tRNA formyltransferase [Planctomycetota bacterium]NUQ34859.1 methionyl-tRNA formyltransferase [Planctomycetaceae bacterium]